ncbi:MAG: amino acid adenylation domain-containing protein [Oscillospiraceae bacterium]|nr:amino acid adenylation domain-containing protein [Oscillospiraceae bacterium]
MFLLERLKTYAGTDRTAILYGGEVLSYARLDAWSDAFAAWLLARFGEDRTPILIYGHKELSIPACMFGALKSGRGYVPVDTTFPRERVAQIVEAVRPRVIVDFCGLGLEAPAVLDGMALTEILESGGTADRGTWITPGQTAYILFTSGSTGQPKGVQITAGNIAAFSRGVDSLLRCEGEGGTFLNAISYSFDVSVCALYYALSRGMTLYTVDRAALNDARSLFAALAASGIDIWVSTPSLGELCLQSEQFDRGLLPRVQKFIFCGEVMTSKLGREVRRRFPGARVYNAYGPTETTVLVTAVEATDALCAAGETVPIGYGFGNLTCQIADPETGALLPDGQQGELRILGECVSPGYLGDPERTARSFFERDGVRGYRTGDLCSRENGMIYYYGRLDGQVKLNGFRVELEDVERNLTKVPNIARAAVVPEYRGALVQGLTAYVLLEAPDGLGSLQRAKRIKEALGALVPSYMVPRKIVAVDAFPLNTNGKVDKKALSAGGKP